MSRKIWIATPIALIEVCGGLMFWYNHEPELFDPLERARLHAEAHQHSEVVGVPTVSALLEVVNVLLNKRGGYLSNDKLPPWVLLDNVPNWEFGVVVQVRDLARVLRNDFGRSQTQAIEDPDRSQADPLFHY